MLPKTREKIYNNYFSVGVDAKVALDFHIAREKNPENFTSRGYNKWKYFQYGAGSVIGGIRNLYKKISLEIDGKPVRLSKSLEGVVVLNLPSYASGTNPWGTGQPSRADLKPQEIDDKIVEVVGVNGTIHLAQIRTGTTSGIHIGQGKKVKLVLKEALPVQADGEPWLQEPAIMEVTHHNQARMLQRKQTSSFMQLLTSPWWKRETKDKQQQQTKDKGKEKESPQQQGLEGEGSSSSLQVTITVDEEEEEEEEESEEAKNKGNTGDDRPHSTDPTTAKEKEDGEQGRIALGETAGANEAREGGGTTLL